MNQIFLNIKELSNYLSVKESWIRSMVFKSQIPYYKIGRLIKFKKCEIDQWIESQFKGPDPPRK